MDERDPPPMRASSWPGIDEPNAIRRQLLQCSLYIRCTERDVMDCIAALGEKAGNRSFGIGWMDEFNVTRSSLEGDRLDALLAHQEPLTAGKAKRLILGNRGVEIADHDANVVQRQ